MVRDRLSAIKELKHIQKAVDFSENNETVHAKTDLKIGRDEDNHVITDDTTTSSHHCFLFRDEFERWVIRDAGSSQGTFVNWERVSERLPKVLENGDEIEIGQTEIDVILQS